MIDTKYGLKYSMPHSVVHIVDNSAYTGALPVILADDPSLFSTIVVTGCPMGEDNKIINITRSDILEVSFGMSSVSASDRTKYGQTIDYASSILSQKAPVKFMRITPEDATYAFACIVVQWRVDETDKKFHVRFKTKELPETIQLNKFQNTSRLNAALIKSINATEVDSTTSLVWNQRVFINTISAGRGKIYNNMAFAINSTSQSKRPPNARYEFVTINTNTNAILERFYASLINIDNANRTDAIDAVNNVVSRRVSGSSVIVPYVNEAAVNAVYMDYMNYLSKRIADEDSDEFDKNVYKIMNVNIFDMIYGNYIYNGDTNVKLPFYQVDAFDSNITRLSELNRVTVSEVDYNKNGTKILYDKLLPFTYGLTRTGDSVYVGDLFLTTTGTSNSDPKIAIVGAINQYTGAITPVVIPKIRPLTTAGLVSDSTVKSVAISAVFNDTTKSDGSGSKTIKTLINKKSIAVGSLVARVSASTNSAAFTLYTVATIVDGTSEYTLAPYTIEKIYQSFDWSSHASGSTGVGNIIGKTVDDAAYTRIGAMVVNTETGKVYVNNFDYAEKLSSSDFTSGRINIDKNDSSLKFGSCPSDVNITSDVINSEYDILIYSDSNVTGWNITSTTGIIADGGTGYAVGDTVELSNIIVDEEEYTPKVVFIVDSIDASGAVTGLSVKSGIAADTKLVTGTAITTKTAGSGKDLTIALTRDNSAPAGYKNNPSEIKRCIVSGVQGSIFRVSIEAISIPANYYSDSYGINVSSELGGIKLAYGTTGFFDDDTINSIEFKWRYSALLVKAYRGQIDPRIKSPTRVSAKYLFDGGTNTITGTTILPYVVYKPEDIINASTIFTADEKDEILFSPELISNIKSIEDVDVKQAMYDLMEYRVYQGIPEDKRPIGPGSGLSLYLDSGITDANTIALINTSFIKRFNNPNASWDIGGYVDSSDGMSYTYTKRIVDNLFTHSKSLGVNKPYVGKYTAIRSDEYISYFPDIDTSDWEMRELLYNSGGNAWIVDVNGNLTRRSQRTLYRDEETSDLVQESNMRTLSQLIYLLQNKIDSYLLEYSDDGVLKTLSDEVNNMFSNWVGNLVDGLDISFEKDINIDGGEILVCYCSVVFRGLILRVPIIVNVNRRDS